MYGAPFRPPTVLALVLAVGLAACDTDTLDDSPVEPQFHRSGGWERTAFDVYTQNLFLGGDTGPLFNPDVIGDPVALVAAVTAFWAEVQASDVQGRMAEIADEIGRRNPEVVGVQEALQFVSLDITPGGPVPTGAIDLLATLEAQIQALGLPYELLVEQPTTSSALPMAIDFSTGQITAALNFTDRVAIFKRTDVEVTDQASGVFAAALPLAPGVAIQRGWARATVAHDGVDHHFVTTHLETQGVRPVHDGQAFELLNVVLAGLDGITIVAGDLNSDAAAHEGDPSWTPTYGDFIAAGFADVWELAPHSRRDSGFTCCQDPSLRNEVSELDERIDFVLVRSAHDDGRGQGLRRGHYRADVVNDRPRDRTESGLWPSDHAGLVAGIRTPELRRFVTSRPHRRGEERR